MAYNWNTRRVAVRGCFVTSSIRQRTYRSSLLIYNPFVVATHRLLLCIASYFFVDYSPVHCLMLEVAKHPRTDTRREFSVVYYSACPPDVAYNASVRQLLAVYTV